MESDNSEDKQNKPWLFKKGQSGNPLGRPKGSKTLKTRTAEYLMSLNDEEFIDYLEGLNKIDVWKMAEGNFKQDTEIKGTIEHEVKSINIITPDAKN